MGTQSPSKMGIIFKVMVQGYVFTIVHWKQHFKYQWNLNNIASLSKWETQFYVASSGGLGVGTKIHIGLEENQIKGIHA